LIKNEKTRWLILCLYAGGFFIVAVFATYGIFLGFYIWFHIKNGELIVRNHHIPHVDPFLYTTGMLPPYHFSNYEWLFGVATYWAYSLLGFTGIHLFRTAIILLTFLVVGLTCLEKPQKAAPSPFLPFIALACTCLAFLASYSRFEPRPQLVSALFLSLYAFLTLQKRSPARLVLFFIIALAWANCHIEAITGIVFLALVLIQAALEWLLVKRAGGEERAGELKREALHRLLALGLSLAALVVSPPAKGLLQQALEYHTRKGLSHVVELNPAPLAIMAGPFGLLLFIGLVSLGWAFLCKRKTPVELIVFVPFALLPFVGMRHVLPAAVVMAPVAARGAAAFLESLGGRSSRAFRAVDTALLLIIPALLLYAGAIRIQAGPAPLPGAGSSCSPASVYPDGAIRFLNGRDVRGNLFCPYEWGNFVIFYENPYTPPGGGGPVHRKPFIDGMLQTYNARLLQDYMSLLSGEGRRKDLIDHYNVEIFLIPYPQDSRDSFLSLAAHLDRDDDWGLIYWDDVSIVYARSSITAGIPSLRTYRHVSPAALHVTGGSQALASPQDVLKELEESTRESPGDRVVNTYVWMGIILYGRGDVDGAIAVLERGMKASPDSPAILYNLAVACLKKGEAARGLHLLEQSLKVSPRFAPARELKRKLQARG